MKRDYVCMLRIFIDSFPSFIRNSRLLFRIAKKVFGLPDSLFYFREKFFQGKIVDLKPYYELDNSKSLNRISPQTDINSKHLNYIFKELNVFKPSQVLDIGCGDGYLLNQFRRISKDINLTGIDFQTNNQNIKNSKINFIEGDIHQELMKLKSNSFDFVLCTHVLEHLINPSLVVKEIRRICSGPLIIICPLEKKFKWGFNYHVQFFHNSKSFINFLNLTKLPEETNKKFKTYKYLGDLMYVEYLDSSILIESP